MNFVEQLKRMFNSPSRRKDIDYTKAITPEAMEGVFIVLEKLIPPWKLQEWFYEVGKLFPLIDDHFRAYWDYRFQFQKEYSFGIFKDYLRSSNTESIVFLDFLETAFKNEDAVRENELIQSINLVLKEKYCPYKLSEFAESTIPGDPYNHLEIIYPMVYLEQEPVIETHAIEPVLNLFRDSDFAGPNKLFREALERHRDGNYSGCVTSCSSTLEGAIKVIDKKKGWKSVRGRGVGDLTKSFLKKYNLPENLYPMVKFIAEQRNKHGDAHGQENAPDVTESDARFLIALSATFIVYLDSKVQ